MYFWVHVIYINYYKLNIILTLVKALTGQLTLKAMKYILYKQRKQRDFFQFEIIINVLVSSLRSILNNYVMVLRPLYIFLFFQCRTVCRRQNLTSKVSQI